MVIKCVLFDADGIVIINEKYFSLQYQEIHDVKNEDMLPFFTGIFKDCLIGKADLKEVIVPWLPKWKWEGSVEEFLFNWFKLEDNVDPRVIDRITGLREKGIICILTTNQEKYRTEYMRTEMGFSELFNDIYSSAYVGAHKPDKEFYAFVLKEVQEKYSIGKDEIIFFDDCEKNVAGAKTVGIKSYHYTEFKKFDEIINSI